MFDPTNPTGTNYNDPFGDPRNPLNATRGNWSIDPLYITPGYTANFRPQYSGPMGYSVSGSSMGFWNGMANGGMGNALSYLSPYNMSRIPMYSNPVQYQQSASDAVSLGALDSTSNFMTNFAAPFAAFYAGEALTSGRVRWGMDAATSNMSRWWASATGGSQSQIARAATTRTFSGALGATLGRGMAGGLVGAMGTITGIGASAARGSVFGSAAMGAASLAGGIAGRIGVPIMVGNAIMEGIDHTFVDPYLAVRQGQQSLIANFANQYIGDGGGRITGFGLSRERAGRISGALAQASARDMAFEVGDYGKIADYAARAGMFNDVQDFDVSTIRNRVKSLATQVKMVMEVANEPSLQEAVKMLAKMKVAGASDANGFAAQMISTIGRNAGISGISTQEMMNTVGATGQYLYQSQGLTPYIGIREASTMHAGFTTAFRKGLIDPAAMARMGGVAGATQAAMEGTVSLARTNYNMMGLANQYMFGMSGNRGFSGNIAAFGANMSSDPLAIQGLMEVYGNDMVSAQLRDNPNAPVRQIYDMMSAMGLSNNVGNFASVASSFGLNATQTRALIERMRVANSPTAQAHMDGAIRGQLEKARAATISQHGLDYGSSPVGWAVHGWRAGSAGLSAFGAATAEAVTSPFSSLSDWFSETGHELRYGSPAEYLNVSNYARTAEGFFGRKTINAMDIDFSGNRGFIDLQKITGSSKHGDMYGRARSMAQGLGKQFGDFFGSMDSTSRSAILGMIKNGASREDLRAAIKGLGVDAISKISGPNTTDGKIAALLNNAGSLSHLISASDGSVGGLKDSISGVMRAVLGEGVSGDFISDIGMMRSIRASAGYAGSLDHYLDTGEGKSLVSSLTDRGLLSKGAGRDSIIETISGLQQRMELATGFRTFDMVGSKASIEAAYNDAVRRKDPSIAGLSKREAMELIASRQVRNIRDPNKIGSASSVYTGNADTNAGLVQAHFLNADAATRLDASQRALAEMSSLTDMSAADQLTNNLQLNAGRMQLEAAEKNLKAAIMNSELADDEKAQKLQELDRRSAATKLEMADQLLNALGGFAGSD